jgi:hypothetical protein
MNAQAQFGLNLGFTCPAGIVARSRRDAGVKVWRYRYFGEWPNSMIAPKAGAWHGSEIAMIFGNTELVGSLKDTPEQKQLSRVMMKAWAEFAKNPEYGLSSIGWPVYEQKQRTLVRLGYNDLPYPTLGNNEAYDQNCDLWAQQASLPVISPPSQTDLDEQDVLPPSSPSNPSAPVVNLPGSNSPQPVQAQSNTAPVVNVGSSPYYSSSGPTRTQPTK